MSDWVFWSCPIHLSPRQRCLGCGSLQQVCQLLPVLRKIHRGRRKWVANTPAWLRKTARLTSSPPNIALLAFTLWQHLFNYCWILELIFVSPASPGGGWLDLSWERETWENSQACNKICLFAASQIVKSSRIYKSKACFPSNSVSILTALFVHCGAPLQGWNWSFSLLHSISCDEDSSYALLVCVCVCKCVSVCIF